MKPAAIDLIHTPDASKLRAEQLALALYHPEADARYKTIEKIGRLGLEVQQHSREKSELLREPIKHLLGDIRENTGVADSLIELREKVEDLDPSRFDLSDGWFSRICGYIPGFGTPLKRYLVRFERSQTVINAIVNSMKLGRAELLRDNGELQYDRERLIGLTENLRQTVQFAELLEETLQAQRMHENSALIPANQFEQDILFPLRQRKVDLQQQLAVNQQALLAIGVLTRNNLELVRGVDRALNVTISAMEIAVTIALALENQREVLRKVQSVNAVTNKLIAGTALRLREQGAAIQKEACSAALDIEVLKSAFEDIRAAIDDVVNHRKAGLDQLSIASRELERLTNGADRLQQHASANLPFVP